MTGHENTSDTGTYDVILLSEMKSIHSHECLQEVVLVTKQQTQVLDINNLSHDGMISHNQLSWYFHPTNMSLLLILAFYYKVWTFSPVLTLGRAATW